MEIKRILAQDTRSAKEKALSLCGRDALIISCNQVNDQTELIVAIDRIPLPAKAPLFEPAVIPSKFAKQEHAIGLVAHQSDAQIRSKEIVALVREEIAALRREFQLTEKVNGWQADQELAAPLLSVLAALKDSGVSAGLRTLLADTARDAQDQEEAISEISNILLQSLSKSLPEDEILDGGIHALCGPSGAGKTLTALRLARMAQEQSSGKVALIHYGQRQTNAIRLIETATQIPNIDLLHAENPAALSQLLRKVGRRRMVIIDSPGVRFEQHALDLAQSHPRIKVHGVLRLDSSAASLRRIYQTKGVQWQSYILTHADKQGAAPWPLLECLCSSPLPVSYVSHSKTPTQNLDIFRPNMLVELAMRPVKDRFRSREIQELVPSFTAMTSAKQMSRRVGNA